MERMLLPAALPDASLRVAASASARPPSAAATPRLDQHRRHLLSGPSRLMGPLPIFER